MLSLVNDMVQLFVKLRDLTVWGCLYEECLAASPLVSWHTQRGPSMITGDEKQKSSLIPPKKLGLTLLHEENIYILNNYLVVLIFSFCHPVNVNLFSILKGNDSLVQCDTQQGLHSHINNHVA